MKPPLPFLVAALLFSSSAARARSEKTSKPVVGAPELPLLPQVRPLVATPVDPPPAAKSLPPTANAAMTATLGKIGWKPIENEALVRIGGPEKGYIPGNYLKEADIEWKDGVLNYVHGEAIPAEQLPMVFEGLWIFVSAAKMPADEAGKALAAFGLPPVVDGRKLVNPNGAATYYGQMLRLLYSEKPGALARAGAERLSQALDLLLHAHDQAFEHQSADVAKTDVDRAKLLLFAPVRPGETPFAVKPYEDLAAQLAAYKGKLQTDVVAAEAAGDAERAKESAAALDVLNTLERQRYHRKAELPAVPKPGDAPAEETDDNSDPEEAPVKMPLASGLPTVLKALDRINGTPLTPDQQENLIKSFPMGDLVWRLGAQDLWRQGLTGKNVKVAVIDGGIGHHDELDDAVKSRVNMTAERGKTLTDDHGTHVAGIIHALAPDAQINGYTAFGSDSVERPANPALKEGSDPLIMRAIDKAVKDAREAPDAKSSTLIVSMSLGGGSSPSDALARKVEEYAKQGVIFIVAAGNEHDKNAVEAPSLAPNAISVGALDGAGRAADFSSYGASYDARKLKHVVKSLFMAPGTNVYSTVVGPNGESGYALMDGTSMATPAVSGVSALLAQASAAMSLNPLTLSTRLRDALTEGSAPMSLDKLPSNVPFDQAFLVVQPMAALDALRRQDAEPVAVKNPKTPSRTN